MSRSLRVLVADGWYHVTARGNERRAIFRDVRDHARFLECLEEMTQRYGVRIAVYALMGNHYHLLLQTPRANLSAAMKWLNVSYTVWFNRKHRRAGHLLQGRYKAVLVDGEGAWLGTLADYVHLNPVRIAALGLGKMARSVERAGAMQAPTPEQVAERLAVLRSHRWSSYPAYAGYAQSPEWLTTAEVCERTPGRAKDPRRRYREHLEGQLTQAVPERPWAQLRARMVLGSEEFWRRIQGRGDRAEMTELRKMERRTAWVDVVRAVEAVKGEAWAAFRDRHGDWGRDLALYLARRHCDLTLAELGACVGGLRYAAVGQAIRSFERKLSRGDIRAELNEAETRLFQNLDI